ncbi:MAG: anthranilate synthase component I, partial [Novosphingobium sp.]
MTSLLAQTESALPDNHEAALSQLSAGKSALVWRKLIVDTETPVGAALKLMEPGRGDFLLESVQGGEVRGRYSLLGIDPDLVFRATGDAAQINRAWQFNRTSFAGLPGNALDELRALVASCRIDVPAALPSALACLVGYFGYETIGLVEKLPRAQQSELVLPDMLFTRPTVVLVFDRLSDELFAIAPVWAEGGTPERLLEAAAERIDNALRKLSDPVPSDVRLPETVNVAPQPVMPAA